METFAVDKCFYDIGTSDLKELWDSELDPDVLRGGGGDMCIEWNFVERDPTLPGVILHDRLMTDAVLGTMPIKTEHSYSLASDGDSLPDSDSAINTTNIDMEDDFPTICVNPAEVRLSPVQITIKDEPLSDLDSPTSSCPASPLPKLRGSHRDLDMDTDVMFDVSHSLLKPTRMFPRLSPPKLSMKLETTSSGAVGFTLPPTPPSCSSSEESEDATCSQPASPGRLPRQRVLVQSTRQPIHTPLISSQPFDVSHSLLKPTRMFPRLSPPKLSMKLETTSSGAVGFTLPPTPPSCSSSEESEDATCSQPASPGRLPRQRVLVQSTRQPIHTPLISSQPKGSTGTLVLTEEEKRTLLAEGYPVPTRLPLTKAEEKSLKKIRRKIKNKISAQESRRKKKEYMDQLERKVEILVTENNDYRKKLDTLEDSNNNLMSQLAKLQAIVARTHPQLLTRHAK